ncbi:DUF4062 domain-containing protein [Paenibacillus sp. CMAA1364]
MSDIGKKYQIFISSTFTDLIDARSKVTKVILSMQHFPVGMEMFSAADDDQWTVIKKTIDISDYYVLILAHRYGSITNEGISYTEKEYDYARKIGLPILAFIMNRNASTTPSERESDPILQDKLETFVKKAMDSKMCGFWDSDEELASKVSVALVKEFNNNPRTGWVRAKQLNPNKYELESNINNFLRDKELWGLKKSTIDSYRMDLKIFREYIQEETVSEIGTEQIRSFLRYRENNFNINSNSSMEKIRSVLRVFFAWLVEEKVIERNPVKKIKSFIIQEAVREALDEDEVEEIQSACITPRERALVEIILSTGCQLGELEKMSLKSVKWKEEFIEITGNGRRNRVVMLTNDATHYLQKYLDTRTDDSDFLFVTERRPYRMLCGRTIQREISRIAGRTNINKNIAPSTFRHTFAKRMLDNGYQMYVVQSLLGNKEYTSTSETYLKITNKNIGEVLRTPGRIDP